MFPGGEGLGRWFVSKAGGTSQTWWLVSGQSGGWVAGCVPAASGAVPSQLPPCYPRAPPNLSSAFSLLF